jgi:hypothetical protein
VSKGVALPPKPCIPDSLALKVREVPGHQAPKTCARKSVWMRDASPTMGPHPKTDCGRVNLTAPERSRYSSDPAVRKCLREFFEGNSPTGSAAVYLATGTETASFVREMRPMEELDAHAESGAELWCPAEGCQETLNQFREALRRRKNHERLGCRPFNRLILPDEHF